MKNAELLLVFWLLVLDFGLVGWGEVDGEYTWRREAHTLDMVDQWLKLDLKKLIMNTTYSAISSSLNHIIKRVPTEKRQTKIDWLFEA